MWTTKKTAIPRKLADGVTPPEIPIIEPSPRAHYKQPRRFVFSQSCARSGPWPTAASRWARAARAPAAAARPRPARVASPRAAAPPAPRAPAQAAPAAAGPAPRRPRPPPRPATPTSGTSAASSSSRPTAPRRPPRPSRPSSAWCVIYHLLIPLPSFPLPTVVWQVFCWSPRMEEYSFETSTQIVYINGLLYIPGLSV